VKKGSCIEVRSGVWRLRVVKGYKANGDPIQAQRTFKGKARDAHTALATFIHEVETGQATFSGRMTLDEFLDRYLDHAEANLSSDTVRNYRSKAKRFRDEIGKVRLDKLGAAHLDAAYAKWKLDGMSPSTIKAHHVVISTALRQAVKWGLIPISKNPAPLATKPRVDPRQSTMPTIEVIGKLIDATEAEQPVLSMAILLAALTGVRRGELLGLRWSDLNVDTGMITIARSARRGSRHSVTMGPTKNRRVRQLPIDAVTIHALKIHRERCEEWAEEGQVALSPDSYIISQDPRGLEPWNPDALTAAFSRLARTLGHNSLRFHDLRHAVATTILSEGFDVAVVAGRLGNTAPVTLRYYAHVIEARNRQAAGVMGALLGRR
jgi:integrase